MFGKNCPKEQSKKIRNDKGKGYFIRVPLNPVFLNYLSSEKYLSLSNLPEPIINYNFLLSQKPFVKIIQNGETVKFHSFKKVNKSSGRGDTELIINDGKKLRNILILIGFHIHHTKMFFLVYFRGLILLPMRNSLKIVMNHCGDISTVGMIKKKMIGLLWGIF